MMPWWVKRPGGDQVGLVPTPIKIGRLFNDHGFTIVDGLITVQEGCELEHMPVFVRVQKAGCTIDVEGPNIMAVMKALNVKELEVSVSSRRIVFSE